MDYVTVDGIKKRTGYDHEKDWYLLCLKELLDNAVDFLWNKYQGASDAAIDVYIEKTSKSRLIIRVRNTNPQNFSAFNNLEQIFNFDMTFGSKQNLHIITRGVLGDAMKQILALGYVLIHTKDDGTTFTDEQWEIPLVIRSNKVEYQVFLQVDKANQTIIASPINQKPSELPHTDTEIELTLPIIDESRSDLNIHTLEQFCKEYPIFTTDISFKFKLADYTPDKTPESESSQLEGQQEQQEEGRSLFSLSKTEKDEIAAKLSKAISSPPRKAPIRIEYPALHPISKNWVNVASIGSYKPAEFTTFIESVYDKDGVTVDTRLRQLREGSQMKKNPDNDISIAKLISDPNKAQKIEQLYFDLKKFKLELEKTKKATTTTTTTNKKLSLPYATNPGKRKDILVKRIARLYDNKLDDERAVYKLEYGNYKNGVLDYPYVFEIIAIPYGDATLKEADAHSDAIESRFKGSVNYSISPRGNLFEGEYRWHEDDKDEDFSNPAAGDIKGILAVYDFRFYVNPGSKIKVPCVIFANLVSPRVDYHGHDKSRIDTEHFQGAIIAASKNLAKDIPTYRSIGWTFEKVKTNFGRTRWKGTYTSSKERKQTIRETVRLMLVEKRGLPDVK